MTLISQAFTEASDQFSSMLALTRFLHLCSKWPTKRVQMCRHRQFWSSEVLQQINKQINQRFKAEILIMANLRENLGTKEISTHSWCKNRWISLEHWMWKSKVKSISIVSHKLSKNTRIKLRRMFRASFGLLQRKKMAFYLPQKNRRCL